MFVLNQARFFDRNRDQLNERQLRTVRRMFEAGPDGFEGGMNARKYVSLHRVSQATATRDLQHLVELGALIPVGAGRSARYELGLRENGPAAPRPRTSEAEDQNSHSPGRR